MWNWSTVIRWLFPKKSIHLSETMINGERMNLGPFSPLRRGDNGQTKSFLTVKYKKWPKILALVIQIVGRHDILKMWNNFCGSRTFSIFDLIYKILLPKSIFFGSILAKKQGNFQMVVKWKQNKVETWFFHQMFVQQFQS